MITLHVGGEQVGTLDDAARLIPEFIARNYPIEFRDPSGTLVGTFFPKQKPRPPEDEPDWVRAITPEAIEQAKAGPFFTFEEAKKQSGRE